MTLETPSWLDLSFMEKILRKSEGDNSINVINMDMKPATNKGDNYTSDLFRITAEFWSDKGGRKTLEKKSVIAKIAPTSGVRYEMISQSGIFQTEISMMSTLDKMNKLLGPKQRVSGKALYVQSENPMFLMIEDLAPLGFRMTDRVSGLDLAHTVLALHGLAKYHAASVALCEKEPKQKEIYIKSMFDENHPADAKNFFITSTKASADEIANWPEAKKYSEKVAKLADHIYQIGIDAYKFIEDDFNVIVHGDFQVNNMLFKYDNDGKPTDHVIVDFQACNYNSPTLDLLYFFNSSLSLNVFENKRNILLNEYLYTLSATMKQLNCKTQPPTMEELKASLKRRFNYGMIVSFSILPFMLCSKTEATDLDEIMGISYVNPGLKNENYRKLMVKRLPLYDELGLLDL